MNVKFWSIILLLKQNIQNWGLWPQGVQKARFWQQEVQNLGFFAKGVNNLGWQKKGTRVPWSVYRCCCWGQMRTWSKIRKDLILLMHFLVREYQEKMTTWWKLWSWLIVLKLKVQQFWCNGVQNFGLFAAKGSILLDDNKKMNVLKFVLCSQVCVGVGDWSL